MEKDYKQINSDHYLELADRISIIMGNLDEYCYSHPAANNNIQKFIDKAMNNLWAAYQLTGGKL